MEPVGEPTQVDFRTATEALQAVPYIRGWMMSEKEDPMHWMSVGTGTAHEIVVEHEDEIDLEKPIGEQWTQWGEIFTNREKDDILAYRLPDYVEYVQGKAFPKFHCRVCNKEI